jgi:hypothetical protein
MIIVENECAGVWRIALTADAPVAGAEVTVRQILWQFRRLMLNGFPVPGPVLTVCCHDNPFFAQWVPSFFPNHMISKIKQETEKASTATISYDQSMALMLTPVKKE